MADKRGNHRKTILSGLVLMIILCYPSYSFPICQLDISRFKDDLCRRHYDSRLCNSPSLQGNFASESDCQKAKYQFCGGRGDPFCMSRVSCVQCDKAPAVAPVPQGESFSQETGEKPKEPTRPFMDTAAWEKFKSDALQKESPSTDSAFEKEKNQLVSQLKGSSGNSRSDLGLKKGLSGSSEKKLSLKSGQTPSDTAKSSGEIKLSIAEKAKGSKSIEDLGCIANWSLLAAEKASSGALEQSRKEAGWGFDDWRRHISCPPIKVDLPEVPAPVEANPQYKAYHYIIERIEKIYPEMISNHEKLRVVRPVADNVVLKKLDITAKKTLSKNEEEKKKLEEEEKSLEEQAKALQKEVAEMESKVKTYQEEVKKWRQEYEKIGKDPANSSKLVEDMDKRIK